MKIGLPGLGSTPEKIVRQAERAEADGFASLWYASAVGGDPMTAMALAGRATTSIELGTAIMQTYACHPLLQASRAIAAAAAIGSPRRLTLGVGPSHEVVVDGMWGLSYEHPGRHTEEYIEVLAPLLRGERVSFAGEDFRVKAGPIPGAAVAGVQLLLSALGPRLLRVAGTHSDGTVLWLGNARAISEHIAPHSEGRSRRGSPRAQNRRRAACRRARRC
jgi:F420-dependent oxidoreductase-like protein